MDKNFVRHMLGAHSSLGDLVCNEMDNQAYRIASEYLAIYLDARLQEPIIYVSYSQNL